MNLIRDDFSSKVVWKFKLFIELAACLVVVSLFQSCAFGMGQRSAPAHIIECNVNFYGIDGSPCVYICREIQNDECSIFDYICPGDPRYKDDFSVVSLEEIDCLKTREMQILNAVKRWK